MTYLLQRMTQHIQCLETLLSILTHPTTTTVAGSNNAPLNEAIETNANLEIVKLFKELVYSECHKNDVGEHWQ